MDYGISGLPEVPQGAVNSVELIDRRIRVNTKQLASGKYQVEMTGEVSGAVSLEEINRELRNVLMVGDEAARAEIARRELRDEGAINDDAAARELRVALGLAADAGYPVDVTGDVVADLLVPSGGDMTQGPANVPAEDLERGIADDIPF